MSKTVFFVVTLEILRQLGTLYSKQVQALGRFGLVKPIHNHRGIVTGRSYPVFEIW